MFREKLHRCLNIFVDHTPLGWESALVHISTAGEIFSTLTQTHMMPHLHMCRQLITSPAPGETAAWVGTTC